MFPFMSDHGQPVWSMTESVETNADRAFSFRYLTSIDNMVADPGIERVEADGPHRDRVGMRGRTYLTGGGTVDWVVTDVQEPQRLVIEVALPGASLRFDFQFEDRPGGGSILRQQVSLVGANAREYVDEVEAGFGPTLRDGMLAVRDRIESACAASTRVDEAPVEIVPYDPSWPRRFEQEAVRLRDVLQSWLVGPIEHIGSTAVPGLAAKPVVDIMAGVESLDASRPAIAALERAGYCYAPYRADTEHWFCKPSPQFRTHHLHLMSMSSDRWTAAIAFRDYLRTHPAIAAEYENLKRDLAKRHRLDREAYTAAKGPFVERITALALQEPRSCSRSSGPARRSSVQ